MSSLDELEDKFGASHGADKPNVGPHGGPGGTGEVQPAESGEREAD